MRFTTAITALGLLAFAASLVVAAPGRSASPCIDKDGMVPIIESGRESDISALFEPHELGRPLVGHSTVTFADLPVQSTTLSAIVAEGDVQASLTLGALECEPNASDKSASFSFRVNLPPEASDDLRAGIDALKSAVVQNDDGSFWQARSLATSASGANAGGVATRPKGTLHDTVTALMLILLGALLFLVNDAQQWWRRSGFGDENGRGYLAGLVAITGVGAGIRFGIDPTFIREAYALPSISWLGETIDLGAAIDAYPQGPDLTVSTLGLWVASDPYDAWFTIHQILGSLTIIAAFGAGRELIGHRAGGLLAAALIAFWPQHIRLSASEVTHVHLIFWTFLTLNWAMMAAKNHSRLSFHTLVWLAATMAIMRPEAPLLLLGIAIIALGHGPGIRSEYRSLTRWFFVGFVLWLLYPTFMTILGDRSIDNFTKDEHGESIGLDSFVSAVLCFLIPDGRNAFFDAQTSPLWLWPLALWGSVVLWRTGRRWTALGLGSMVVTYMVLYSGLPHSVVIWKMSRYHATMLPAVVLLTAVGLWDLLERIPWSRGNIRRQLRGGVGIAILGCALWSPALFALPMDWQQDLQGAIDLGRKHSELWGKNVRIVTPDNRRRFLDQSPRSYISALTRGRQEARMAIPVAYAAKYLHTEEVRTEEEQNETYFYGGLYCYLGVLPDESINPQCRAMERIFEMKEIDSVTIDSPPFLVAYENVRIEGPLKLRLFKVGKRKLSPDEAMKLIPAPLGTDAVDSVPGYPVGSATSPFIEAPKPGIGESLAPALKQVPW